MGSIAHSYARSDANFAVFTTFFVPCFTSIGMIGKEIGWKTAVQAALLTLLLATLLATMTKFLAASIPV